jgi:hypothetical protein
MANLVTTTYQINGSKLFTLKVDITGDGSGEVSALKIIDPADLTGKPSDFKIRAIQWNTDGTFVSQLLWDATTDVHAYELGNFDGGIRFSDTGAHLVNNSGAGKTGQMNLTTVGLGNGSKGTIIFEGQHS